MNEKIIQEANEAKMIALNEEVIYPMLNTQIENTIASMRAKLKSGEINFIADVAKIDAYYDILEGFRWKQLKGNKAIKQLSEE